MKTGDKVYFLRHTENGLEISQKTISGQLFIIPTENTERKTGWSLQEDRPIKKFYDSEEFYTEAELLKAIKSYFEQMK